VNQLLNPVRMRGVEREGGGGEARKMGGRFDDLKRGGSPNRMGERGAGGSLKRNICGTKHARTHLGKKREGDFTLLERELA